MYVNRFLDLANNKVEKSLGMVVMRDVTLANQKSTAIGDMNITKVQDYMYDKVLSTYPKKLEMLQYAQQIAGPNLRAMHTMLINKPPDTGMGSSRHPPHQDLWYFTFRPTNRIVCTWTALQPINKDVGGLFCLPGSHILPLQDHGYPSDGIVNKAYFGIQHYAEEIHENKMVHLTMDPGDTVIFHPLLIHGSSRNSSNTTRKAISCHYAATECYFTDVTNTPQEKMVDEITLMAFNRPINIKMFNSLNMPLTFENIWRLKSKVCSGIDVNLHKPVIGEKVFENK